MNTFQSYKYINTGAIGSTGSIGAISATSANPYILGATLSATNNLQQLVVVCKNLFWVNLQL